ncbi:long-chain fatty acid--CoA ligase [Bacillus sp. FJAT-27225]|uniref:class I adenylate-forming enzyme family protein n=1 Tax=Bacillus sp. FJAT-27225 TaxID=1743144 RepID=UPI00080C33B3|nr:long-chain fatty acid--CoA ligase [Bacillus sp. FJAT-27225]OCA83176.1 long-chain fatty acid--CoA ligase [Bacillus sp. FJAT-27225]
MRCELDWLESRAKLTPSATAISDAETDRSWSFEQINTRAKAMARWLFEQGIQQGDRVALLAPNDISYFDLLFACGKIGAIFVPLNWRLAQSELSFIIQDCTPKILCFHSNFAKQVSSFWNGLDLSLCIDGSHYEGVITHYTDKLSQTAAKFAEINDEDPLAMIYTGGTTGYPKGAVLSHRAILWNGISTIVSWNLTNEDKTLTYLPMFHTGGLNALTIPVLMAGGSVAIAREFSPEKAVENLVRYRCTIVLFVPTMYHLLVKSERFQATEFNDMKLFLSGGAPCPLEIYEAFSQKGKQFKEGYGLTEAGPNNFYIDPKDAQKKRGSVGKPMMYNSVKIVNEVGEEARPGMVGELAIQGRHAFSFYWGNEQATQDALREGWLYTGDLARQDEDGYYYIVGRKKDMIITGGEKVYPLEVEHWLCEHPEIQEAAVVGAPDKKWGEAVTAFVVLEEGSTLTEDGIKQFCRLKLGGYKVPKKIFLVEEMPKTHVGKISKVTLKNMAAEHNNEEPVV